MFRSVAIYDLVEERRINDVTVNFFTLLLSKIDSIHDAMRLFTSRSHKGSKYGKNVSDTLHSRPVCQFFCSYHILMSSVNYD